MTFAIGKIADMLGPEYAPIDQHPTRVRLPDEPLMLVDRIVSVEGERLSMTSGRVVTEHDVLPGAWYLDNERIPTCVAVEAGQADLFLSGYLGIDMQTRGRSMYRLLDADVAFHRGLPQPGETIRYDIRIERFFRHGHPWFFHFSFEGTVNGEPLITMLNGCAGFFTEAELAAGEGIVTPKMESGPKPGTLPEDWRALAPMARAAYDEGQLACLRRGDLAGCFGPAFASLPLHAPMRLPDGKMNLVHRVIELDPKGGRYGADPRRGRYSSR
jgi:3-hydroxymyristoyl/3-hydroxydecanoyl-(acyl carrier protein) dehydratase